MSWNNNVRLDDCVELYNKKDMCTIINDGKIVKFEKKEMSNEEDNNN